MLVARLDEQLGVRYDGTDQTVGVLWAEEQPRLMALPAHHFDAAAPRLVSVSRRSLVRVEGREIYEASVADCRGRAAILDRHGAGG